MTFQDQPVIQSNYLGHIYRPVLYKKIIKNLARLMSYHTDKYETIAFSGMSGAAVAYPIGSKLGKHLCCVRKKRETSHFMRPSTQCFKVENVSPLLEGRVDDAPYCIVDDFVESGKTIRFIAEEMGGLPSCVFLYYDEMFDAFVKTKKFGEEWDNVPFYKL